MKRSDVIKQLVNEGFSEKTLVNFSDKQLIALSSRILSEQMSTATISTGQKPTTINLNSKSSGFNDAYRKVQSLPGSKNINVTEESKLKGLTAKEVKEGGVPGLKAKSGGAKLGHGTVKEEGPMPGLTVKTKKNIDKPTPKPGKEEGEVREEKPSSGLSAKKKSEVVKKARKGEDIGKKGKGFKKVVAAAKKGGAKDPEAVAAASMWKNIKREGKEINEWVDNVAQKYYHPFTTKNDIMEMISTKINETKNKLPNFLTAKAIKSSGGEVETMDAPAVPKTKPGTKPGTIPTPKTPPRKNPYKPGPGKSPHPKALAENQPKVPVAKPGKETISRKS